MAEWEAECLQLESECEFSAEEILARHGFGESGKAKSAHGEPFKQGTTRAKALCEALHLRTMHDIVNTDPDRVHKFARISASEKIQYLHLVLLCRQALMHSGQSDARGWDAGAIERGTHTEARERVSFRSKSDTSMRAKTNQLIRDVR